MSCKYFTSTPINRVIDSAIRFLFGNIFEGCILLDIVSFKVVVRNLRNITNSISKGSNYMKIDFGDYSFLDVRNYCSPGVDLSKFGSMWGIKDIKKEIFPYDWFSSEEKLHSTVLPPFEKFFNKIKNSSPTEKEYN